MAISAELRARNEERRTRRTARQIARQTARLQVQAAVRAVVEAGPPEWLRGEGAMAYQAEVDRLLLWF